MSVHLRYESDCIKLRATSIFYRNKRDLYPERDKVPWCFCALVVAGEWLLFHRNAGATRTGMTLNMLHLLDILCAGRKSIPCSLRGRFLDRQGGCF